MNSLVRDLRRGAVSLWRSPGYSVVAMLTLAVGIGASVSMFTVIQTVLLRPLPYDRPDELVMVWNRYERTGAEKVQVAPPDFVDYRERATTFVDMAAFRNSADGLLTGEFSAEHINLTSVSPNFFDLLGRMPMLGRGFTEADSEGRAQTSAVILSHGLWTRRYGADPGLVGRAIEINGESREVIGILPADFELVLPDHDGGMLGGGASDDVDVWTTTPARWLRAPQRGYGVVRVVGRLAEGRTLAEAGHEMTAIAAQLRAEHEIHEQRGVHVDLVPMHGDVVAGVQPMMLALFGAVGIVLLIACANAANLALVRGAQRTREVAVRAALGGTRMRIVREMLAESSVLAACGGVLGVVLATVGVERIAAFAPGNVPRIETAGVDGTTLLFALGASVFVVLVSGVVPALRAASPDLVSTLKDGSAAAGKRGGWGRNAIVVAEVALSMVLLVTGVLLVQTFVHMAEAPLGFQTDTTMTAKVMLSTRDRGEALRQKTEALRASIETLPGVEAAGYSWPIPLSGRGLEVPYSADRPAEGAAWGGSVATRSTVSPSYFQSIGARLVAGRSFTTGDVDRVLAQSGQPPPEGQERPPSVAVIDNLMAERLFPGADPVGRIIWLGTGVTNAARSYEVIGVVEHMRHDSVVGVEREAVFVTGVNLQVGLVVRTTSADPETMVASVEGRLRELDSQGVLFETRTFARSVDDELAPTRFAASLALVFAGLAVGLAAIGLYGVISYSVSQKTRDFGVRLALGAEPGAIRRLVLRQGMTLALIGIVIGAAAAVSATRVISSVLYGVTATDVTTFLAVGLMLALVTLLACYVPAYRATRLDPLEALRSE